MRSTDAALDLVANAALAGAVALLLARPGTISRIAASPALPKTRDLAFDVVGRLARPSRPRRSRHLRRLISTYFLSGLRMPRPILKPQWRLARSAGHRLNDSAAMLALSVLADSAVEHYRGSFHNRAMYTPLVTSALTFCAGLFGSADPRSERHPARDIVYAGAAATGFAGLAFHLYNVLKRPGGMSWLNLFYSAPIGAPMALVLAGLLGRGAERVRDAAPNETRVLGLPAGRVLAGIAAAGLAGTVGEAGLLHFRGGFQNLAMLLPVTVPPVASVLLAASAIHPTHSINRFARGWLRLTALLGFAGVGFHIYGVSRAMGGWRNWSQNMIDGPPLPAPPSFTGLALAGLAALSLIEEERDG